MERISYLGSDIQNFWCNNVVDNRLLDFLAGLTAFSPVTGLSYTIAVLIQEMIVFSYRIQDYCASMVYSDESATYGHFKILYH